MLGYYKKQLVYLFNQINKINNDPISHSSLIYELQLIILKKILYIEKRIKKKRNENNNLKRQLSTPCEEKVFKEISSIRKSKILCNQVLIDKYIDLKSIFKEIADSLVYIYLPYDDIRALSRKQDHGFLLGKSGLKLELKSWKEIIKSGSIAFMADITNCLRHGDIISIAENGSYLITEVKSSNIKNKRANRQEKTLQNICEYLNNDVSEKILPDKVMYRLEHIRDMNIKYDNTDMLMGILKKSKRKRGYVLKNIEDGLYYIATYNYNDRNWQRFKKFINNYNGQLKIFIVNDIKHKNFGYLPFPLIIKDSNILYEFYAGNCVIIIMVDIEYIKLEFARRGIIVKFSDADKNNIFSLKKYKDHELLISYRLFYQMIVEFMSLKSFIYFLSQTYESLIKNLDDYKIYLK